MDISVIIPAFNGGDALKELFQRICEELNNKISFEVLFIFDNGSNKTWKTIEELRSENPGLIRAYHLVKNYGQHRALKYGCDLASGDFIITMDEDLQHDPSDILILMDKQREGDYDVVYGRFIELQRNNIRKGISNILRKLLKKFIPHLYEYYSPYRLIKKDTAKKIVKMYSPYILIDDLLCRVTQSIDFVDIKHYSRISGKSSYTYSVLIKHALLILLAYSKLVLVLVSISGICIVTGILLYLFLYFKTNSWFNTGFSEKYILIINISGLIFLALGLIGEYINRHNVKTNEMPIKLKNEDSI